MKVAFVTGGSALEGGHSDVASCAKAYALPIKLRGPTLTACCIPMETNRITDNFYILDLLAKGASKHGEYVQSWVCKKNWANVQAAKEIP